MNTVDLTHLLAEGAALLWWRFPEQMAGASCWRWKKRKPSMASHVRHAPLEKSFPRQRALWTSAGKIRALAEMAVSKLRELSVKADEMEMAFGFNLSAQSGALIASATAASTYTLSAGQNRQLEGGRGSSLSLEGDGTRCANFYGAAEREEYIGQHAHAFRPRERLSLELPNTIPLSRY